MNRKLIPKCSQNVDIANFLTSKQKIKKGELWKFTSKFLAVNRKVYRKKLCFALHIHPDNANQDDSHTDKVRPVQVGMQQKNGNARDDYDRNAGPDREADRQIDDLQTLGEEVVADSIKKDAQKTGEQFCEAVCITDRQIPELLEEYA